MRSHIDFTQKTSTLEDVHSFWNTEACGTHLVREPEIKDKREFYERYSELRYRTEWHIQLLVPFEESRGKKVLEIGCGNGADGAMFARNGANYTGIDLTQAAVDATREHFDILGLEGNFQRENVERLSFDDNTFDIAYSWGVLHHTPVPAHGISEIYRVLKPNGRAIIMLYHKHSFNYYVRIMGYMRLRVIMEILSNLGKDHGAKGSSDAQIIGLRGNESGQIWGIHYSNFLKKGWAYLRADNFVHHCTDGPECPYAYVFTRSDIERVFSAFREIETKVGHFPLRKYHFGKWIPFSVEKYLALRMGWNLVVFARK